MEDSLERLDKLTQEEARMASAELLKMTQSVDGKVMGVDDRVKGVEGKMQDVLDDVQDVGGMVRGAEGRVRGDVQDICHKVQGVDDKLDRANRSLLLNTVSLFRPLKQYHREPAQRLPSTMARAPRSIYQS